LITLLSKEKREHGIMKGGNKRKEKEIQENVKYTRKNTGISQEQVR
jgi:hypothetical protein